MTATTTTPPGPPARPGRAKAPRVAPWAAAALLALALAGCGAGDGDGGNGDGGGSQGAEAPVKTATVATEGNTFEPAAIEVKAGDTVTWNLQGGIPHDVTGDGWSSGPPKADTTFTHTFDQSGTYDYRCTIHPGMNGQVVVKAA